MTLKRFYIQKILNNCLVVLTKQMSRQMRQAFSSIFLLLLFYFVSDWFACFLQQLDSDSVEIVNLHNTKPLTSEDPIQSYDTVVRQMKQSGVQWIPPDQTDRKLSEVRLAAPDDTIVVENGANMNEVSVSKLL